MSPTDGRSLADSLPDELKDFIASGIVVGDLALPSRYPKPDELDGWQAGFRFHGHTGESLVSTAPGAWQPGWYVIALNGFDDPVFIDISEKSSGFPVYYAPHGAGRWDKTVVAPNLLRFGQLLAALAGMADDDEQVLQFIEKETDTTNAFWRLVHQERRDRDVQGEQAAYDPKDFQDGTLVITGVGPNKMKVAQLLRRARNVSLQEILPMLAKPEIAVASGPLISVRRIQGELTALGLRWSFGQGVERVASAHKRSIQAPLVTIPQCRRRNRTLR
ncbi:SMI1/KNR4 family protein [Bradyrhizobium prioriisuperbiae]|uniref:SMI1/KNR4 family protein n=1 Tax=Bradyrhizobium prioriisuperbiae TaxID=2854389 RepID=UPI0028E820F6|nr:SMI1/KNR4 family protein [Bradyrhizobium prioritasuperba]